VTPITPRDKALGCPLCGDGRVPNRKLSPCRDTLRDRVVSAPGPASPGAVAGLDFAYQGDRLAAAVVVLDPAGGVLPPAGKHPGGRPGVPGRHPVTVARSG
jgi:hypothetical protein